MPDENWKDFEALTKGFTNSKQFQDFCYAVYLRDKEKIHELVRWRRFLRVVPYTTQDTALGFLIYYLGKKYPDKWKNMIYRIMKQTIKLPPGLYETFLSCLVKGYQIKFCKSGLEKGHEIYDRQGVPYSEKVLKRVITISEGWFGILKEHFKKKNIVRLRGPPGEILPIWYHVAAPENLFYKNEKLEQLITPLIKREEVDLNVKAKNVNYLNGLFAKHSWHEFYEVKAKPILTKLGRAITAELKTRKKIINEKNIIKVNIFNKQLSKWLKIQRDLLNKLKAVLRETNIPSLETHHEIRRLFESLNETLDNEEKRLTEQE